MKKLILGIFIIFCVINANAQQDPQFTHYSFNPEYINAGAAGLNDQPFVRAIYRNQWIGQKSSFDGNGGNPVSQVLTASMPLLAIDGGVALNVINDVAGPNRYSSAQLSLSKHVKIGDGKLGIGFQGSFGSMLSGRKGIEWRTPDTPAYLDPTIPVEGFTESIIDMAGGLWYKTKKYYGGLSIDRLLDSDFNNTLISDGGSKKHLYLMGGYNIEIDYNLVITPTMLFKTDFAKADKSTSSIEVGAKALYDDTYWGGLNFRQGGALGVLLGASFLDSKELKVGYALDIVFKGVSAKAGTSHELIVGYYFPKLIIVPKPIIRTPRYKF